MLSSVWFCISRASVWCPAPLQTAKENKTEEITDNNSHYNFPQTQNMLLRKPGSGAVSDHRKSAGDPPTNMPYKPAAPAHFLCMISFFSSCRLVSSRVKHGSNPTCS